VIANAAAMTMSEYNIIEMTKTTNHTDERLNQQTITIFNRRSLFCDVGRHTATTVIPQPVCTALNGTNCCIDKDEPLYRIWLLQKGDAAACPWLCPRKLIQGVPLHPKGASFAEAAQWQ